MAQKNKSMAAKHAKARKLAMKEALYISGKGIIADIHEGRFTPPKNYVRQYFLRKEA